MRQQEAGTAVAELIRKLGIRDQTFYRCKRKYADWVLPRREGWVVNHKLVYRLSVEESLILRKTGPKRRKSNVVRQERSVAQNRNDSWRMDFMSDQLFEGRRFRILT